MDRQTVAAFTAQTDELREDLAHRRERDALIRASTPQPPPAPKPAPARRKIGPGIVSSWKVLSGYLANLEEAVAVIVEDISCEIRRDREELRREVARLDASVATLEGLLAELEQKLNGSDQR